MAAPQGETAPRSRRPTGLASLKTLLTVVVVLGLFTWAADDLKVTPGRLVDAKTWKHMGDLLMRMGPYFKIDRCGDAEIAFEGDQRKIDAVCKENRTLYWYRKDYLVGMIKHVPKVWPELMETIRMAILASFVGSVIAVPFSVLAARNMMSRLPWLYYLVRTFLNLVRTIPDLVLAAVLAGAFGIGVLPGIMALSVFSFTLITKLTSETVEAIDPGPLEAMSAVGAGKIQSIGFGVVPQVAPSFIAYTLYVLEVNVRASFILGWVGAGGIGHALNVSLTLGKFREVTVIIAIILAAVVVIDFISTKLRERLV
jgi:phosphonate transport system permease protein